MARYESVIPKLEMERKLNQSHTTADGKHVRLGEIEESRLLNLIRWVEKRAFEVGAPITDYFDDDNGNAGTVVVARMGALESLEYYGYQDLVDVYNYRFSEVNEIKIPF